MALHPLAGQPAPPELLVNVPRLVTEYYARRPDPDLAEERVVFDDRDPQRLGRIGHPSHDRPAAGVPARTDSTRLTSSGNTLFPSTGRPYP